MSDPLSHIPVDEENPQDHRIAWWFENTIIRSIKRLFNAIGGNIRELLSTAVSNFVERYEQELIPIVKPFLEMLIQSPNIPQWFKKPIQKALSGESQAGLAILAIVVPVAAAALSKGVEGPIGRMIEYAIDNIVRSRLFDPGTAILMWRRGILGETRVNTILHQNGITNAGIVALKALSLQTEDDSLLTQALWRKTLSQEAISDILGKRGMSSQHIALWFNARELIPSPSELISMAVREAFNDKIASDFGYDENYPTEAGLWAKKQGMSEEWFKRAWRSHWVLPGLTQVREMYHREIIDDDVLEQYLLSADIPAFWRKNITLWMDKEVTRVDVRRIFSLGLISPEDVYLRYQKLGYNDEDSLLMTQWTVAEYSERDRDLTKTDILNMYEDNVLNPTETTTYLTALGYRDDDITLLMIHRDLMRQDKYEKLVVNNTKKLFIAGIYDTTQVYAELGKLDTPGHYIEETLIVWRLEKKARVKIPTITQLRDMVDANAISQQTFIEEMRSKGYQDKYIQWYINMWFNGG